MSEQVQPLMSDRVDLQGVSYSFAEVSQVIQAFYAAVAQDPLLKEPFSSVSDWPHHVARLTHFWWVRLGGRSYLQASYNPPLKHFEAGFNQSLLDRWLDLFAKTLNTHLTAPQAERWFSLAGRMGVALHSKNEYLKAQRGEPPQRKPESSHS